MTLPEKSKIPLDEFGEALANARRSQGYTTESISKMFGHSRQMFSYFETGTYTPNRQTLTKLCKLLSLPYRAMAEKAADRLRDKKLAYYLEKGDRK